MEKRWFVYVNDVTYGPFGYTELVNMVSEHRILSHTLVVEESKEQWVEASTIPGLFSTSPKTNQTPNNTKGYAPISKSQPTTKVKKRHGCLRFFLFIILVIIAFSAFVNYKSYKDKQKMELGNKESVVSASVQSSATSIEVKDQTSDIVGFTIDIPSNAYDKVDFAVSTREIKSHKFGEDFNPITPLISIDNNETFSDEVITVTIPIDIEEDEFAMAFYYTKEGELEALPLIYEDKSTLIVATKHFSDIVATKIDMDKLKELTIDTGFVPGIDDWGFANAGSEAADGGFCAGQSASMAYYYYERKLNGAETLHEAYDNNHEVLVTRDLDYDDSLGIRLASQLQKEGNWEGYYYDYLYEYVLKDKYVSDTMLFFSFAYALKLTGDPQLMAIFVRDVNNNIIKLKAGHAIIIYKIENGLLYVSDPNFPGNRTLTIPYDGKVLGPYVSKTSANEPDMLYNSFSLAAKSALFDWNSVGEMFTNIDKSKKESTIGDNIFSPIAFTIDVDYDEKGRVSLSEPEVVVLEDAAKGRIREAYRTTRGIPVDWMTKDYIVLDTAIGLDRGYITVYSGTKIILESRINTTAKLIYIPVTKGVNDIGLHYEKLLDITDPTTGAVTGQYGTFVDFYRVRVENGKEDITGEWEGVYRITEFGKVKDYAVGIGEMITKGILKVISTAFDFEMPSDEEIHKAVEENIEEDSNILADRLINVNITEDANIEDTTYNIIVTVIDDETQEEVEMKTTGTYDSGKLIFKATYLDGSTFEFETYLLDHNTFGGTFEVAAGGMGQLLKGDCELHR